MRLIALGSSAAIALAVVSAPLNTARAADDVVTLAFAGDIHFENQLAVQGKSGGLRTVPALLADADLAMVNLETSIGTHGRPQAKRYTFRAPPRVLNTLAEVGVDVVTQANNHSVDYGRAALADAVAAKHASPVAIVGLGATLADAVAAHRVTIKGMNFSIFGVDAFRPLEAWRAGTNKAGVSVWKWNRTDILAAVRAAADVGDVVVVYVHWGEEYDTCPRASQKSIANQLIAAGAKIIVGAHPHVLQGVGYKSGALVDYSIGNFAWYGHAGTPTAVLRVQVVSGQVASYEMVPVMWNSKGLPSEVTGKRAAKVRSVIAKRNKCDDLAAQIQ